jgi:type VI secretion system secreted protein Hcp
VEQENNQLIKSYFEKEGTAMALACHFTMEGEKQGKIEGSCEMEGRVGSLIGFWFLHQVKIPHNPLDGHPIARPDHYPLKIIIGHDQCSPKLHQALCTGERMKYVQIEWYRVNKYGYEELYFTHRLEDAVITRIESFMPNTISPYTADIPYMEKISFSYKYIRWTYIPDGIEAEDPYVSEYGKHPLKDIGVALRIGGAVVWEGKKLAAAVTVKAGEEGAKAALFEFFEVPWYMEKLYGGLETLNKVDEISEDIKYGLREIGQDIAHDAKDIKFRAYGPK